MTAAEEKLIAIQWQKYTNGIRKATPIDKNETEETRSERIKRLEAPGNEEEWIKYYFKKYAFAEPADFQKKSSLRIFAACDKMQAKGSGKFYQSRKWARGLSKSTRRMMELFYLMFVKKFPINMLLISKSEKNALKLLKPYRGHLEANERIIQDYGRQYNAGAWTDGEFTTLTGNSFLAVGREQSPRGAKNEEMRVNVVDFDDTDDDELCRNPDRVEDAWNWIEQAVIPTVEISKPYFIFFDNNVIAEDSLTLRAAEKANDSETVNIRDENGVSTWPEKNTEEMIDEMLSNLSYASAQKEYFNNPMSTGKTFAEMHWGECPPLKEMPFAVVYADPAPSNKDKPGAKSNLAQSRKAVFIVARKKNTYYIYSGFLDVMGTAIFISSLYACRDYVDNACPAYFYIENNTLQDPFYEQVLLKEVYEQGPYKGGVLGILPDTRKKPEKWPRIEATLEPLNRMSNLIMNIKEKDNPHMKRLESQFKAAKATSKELDGPDAIEGAVYIISQKINTLEDNTVQFQFRSRSPSKGY